MLEILQFIFRNFWTFCGTIVLIYAVGVYIIVAPLSVIACIISGNNPDEKKIPKLITFSSRKNKEDK